MFLGENLLGWLLLALGGAMAVGNLFALFRPPSNSPEGARPPVFRTLRFVLLGLMVFAWALGTLVS